MIIFTGGNISVEYFYPLTIIFTGSANNLEYFYRGNKYPRLHFFWEVKLLVGYKSPVTPSIRSAMGYVGIRANVKLNRVSFSVHVYW